MARKKMRRFELYRRHGQMEAPPVPAGIQVKRMQDFSAEELDELQVKLQRWIAGREGRVGYWPGKEDA